MTNHHGILNLRNVSIIDFGACLTFLMFHSYQFMSWRALANKRNEKYMPLTKIDISLRNKVDIKNHYLCVSMLQLIRRRYKRMFFFFRNQISFHFYFSYTCLIGTFKKTEYSPICKVFTELFNRQNSTFHSSNYSRPEVFCIYFKVFLKFLKIYKRKHLCHSFFFSKVAGLVKTPSL